MARPKGSLNKRTPSPFCTIEGCEEPHFCKGLCKKHYKATKRYPDKVKEYNFNYYNTGWTLETYNEAKLLQDNRCAICGDPPKKNDLNADHDHRTGKPRELLCIACNRGLGFFNDDINKLRSALAYLKKHSPEHGEVIPCVCWDCETLKYSW